MLCKLRSLDTGGSKRGQTGGGRKETMKVEGVSDHGKAGRFKTPPARASGVRAYQADNPSRSTC